MSDCIPALIIAWILCGIIIFDWIFPSCEKSKGRNYGNLIIFSLFGVAIAVLAALYLLLKKEIK